MVFISDIVNFKSEYRYYIINKNIRGMCHYSGMKLIPDINIVNKMVEHMGNKLGGSYILDVGILSTGETALVEVNIGFSFGNYGIDDNLCIDLTINAFKFASSW